ncbi:MAG: hypothetical protein A2Y57_02850 [Candidatus Woykebacteria bacterium RBG_13_40_7b]|uniref:SGNH hydrolase-type esterase domain-containing protein n=1 Tax=Candidatus Woykebacteria bacterium RBG_13_40_7b TaxID=1802594 RepID=A0A1G1W5E0_9BACT|nr:MAG: hypothetical protein A2Y57_02850 [Candidatus Woykebacteria bacterium RBG_13_40_7b]
MKKIAGATILILVATLAFFLVYFKFFKEKPREMETTQSVVTEEFKYVALGDSAAVGVGASIPDKGYVGLIFEKLKEKYPKASLNNLAVSGATTTDLINAQLNKAKTFKPDLVTISVGANDITGQITDEIFSQNIEQALTTLDDENLKIVLTNIPDISLAAAVPVEIKSKVREKVKNFNKIIENSANKFEIPLVDLYSASLKEAQEAEKYLSSDLYHPNDSGYELWADEMWKVIDQFLSSEKN